MPDEPRPTDDADRPEPEVYGLVVPFIVCQTQGGPFDDEAFVSGFQCGEIDKALAVAASVRFTTVRTAVVRQLDLLGMHRGYPVMTVTESEDYPEWSEVLFERGGE